MPPITQDPLYTIKPKTSRKKAFKDESGKLNLKKELFTFSKIKNVSKKLFCILFFLPENKNLIFLLQEIKMLFVLLLKVFKKIKRVNLI